MKKILLVLLLIFISSFIFSCSNEQESLSNLTIFELNDTHGFIEQDTNSKLGLSNLYYNIKADREEIGYDNSLFFCVGDMFQGTALVKMTFGRVMVDVLNEMKIDGYILGNHEFDWGINKILAYFDGNKDNGEANFPLINSNLYDLNNNLITIDNGNIFQTYTYNKSGVKVGVLGYLGDVENDINYVNRKDYHIGYGGSNSATKISKSVETLGKELKDSGCDIIIVGIHGGNSSGADEYDVNIALSKLKYNGSYLVDAVLNGHTHSDQEASIYRSNGVSLPIVQSNGYRSNQTYQAGRVDLIIDSKTKKVVSYEMSHYTASQAGTNYDENLETIIDTYHQASSDILDGVLCYSPYYIDRYGEYTYKWVASVGLKATGADVFILNTGGIRTGMPAGNLTYDNFYEFYPFDNLIIMYEFSATQINKLLNEKYIWGLSCEMKESGTYTVAMVDYLFFKDAYTNYVSKTYTVTDLLIHDLLLEDLTLRDTFNIYKDYEALIECKLK